MLFPHHSVLLLLSVASGLTIRTVDPGPPAEATLRTAPAFATAFAGESATASCLRLPFARAHAHTYASWWHPHELDSPELWHNWFNVRERAYSDVFHAVLQHARYPPTKHSVYDLGSNTGWYASFGAMRGYNVTAIDMQPECNRRARCASVMNQVAHRIEFHTAYAADATADYPLQVAGRECFSGISPQWRDRLEWYGFTEPVHPLHVGRHIHRQFRHDSRRVAIMKVDIEGGEVFVMRSLAEAGALAHIDHMIVEYSPHMWGSLNVTAQQGQEAFAPLFDAGFVAVDLPEIYTVQPAQWRRSPDTGPGLPLPGSGSRVIRGRAELAAYTDAMLESLSSGFGIFTLWFFRKGDARLDGPEDVRAEDASQPSVGAVRDLSDREVGDVTSQPGPKPPVAFNGSAVTVSSRATRSARHVVIELGSNIGDWMAPYLQQNPAAVPIMVEALPRFYVRLEAIAQAHGGAFYPRVAWSSEGHNLTFYEADDGDASVASSVYASHVQAATSSQQGSVSGHGRVHAELEGGATVPADSAIVVPSVDVVTLIERHTQPGDYVVMRMDIEGAEYEVLRRLLVSGRACRLNELHVESHSVYAPDLQRFFLVDLTLGWILDACATPPRLTLTQQRGSLPPSGRITEHVPGCSSCPWTQETAWYAAAGIVV